MSSLRLNGENKLHRLDFSQSNQQKTHSETLGTKEPTPLGSKTSLGPSMDVINLSHFAGCLHYLNYTFSSISYVSLFKQVRILLVSFGGKIM